MRKRRSWLAVLLAAVLALALIPATALAGDTQTLTYRAGERVSVPLDTFGDAWNGTGKATAQIQDKTFAASLDFESQPKSLVFTMPWSLDLEPGTYPVTVTFTAGDETRTSQNLALQVEEAVSGSRVSNQLIACNGNSDVILRFRNGTGASRITWIESISFLAALGPGASENDVTEFSIYPEFNADYVTVDLNRGEIRIDKDYFRSRVEEFGWQFLPYVYVGTLGSFTLANGVTVTEESTAFGTYPYEYGGNLVTTPMPGDTFVNDGRDYWYLVFTDTDEAMTVPPEVSLCPGKTADLRELITAPAGAQLHYEVLDGSVAQVDENGILTGLKDGDTAVMITATVQGRIVAQDTAGVHVGHTAMTTGAKEPTCTAPGYTGDTVCRDCGLVLAKGTAIDKIPHQYQDGKCIMCGAKEDTLSPETGDSSTPVLWMVLLLTAAAALPGMYRRAKRS